LQISINKQLAACIDGYARDIPMTAFHTATMNLVHKAATEFGLAFYNINTVQTSQADNTSHIEL
jgi:hypothetical protein